MELLKKYKLSEPPLARVASVFDTKKNHSNIFNNINTFNIINNNRDILNQAKLQAPGKVELVCLKDRFGTPIYNCDFNYYSKHDCFIPEEDDEYDFNEIPDEYLNTLPYNI